MASARAGRGRQRARHAPFRGSRPTADESAAHDEVRKALPKVLAETKAEGGDTTANRAEDERDPATSAQTATVASQSSPKNHLHPTDDGKAVAKPSSQP